MFLPGFRSRWAKVVSIDSADITAQDLAVLREGDLVDVRLAGSAFFTKTFRFPKAARGKLAKAVDLKVRQTSPKRGEGMVWRHAARTGPDSEILVDVFFLKSSFISNLEKRMISKGARLRMVTIADCPDALPFIDRRKSTDRPVRFWSLALILMALAWVVSGYIEHSGQLDTLEREARALSIRHSALSDQAVALSQAENDASGEQQKILADLDVFAMQAQHLPLILKLTDAFPDSAWVSDLTLQSNSLRLSVFTADNVTTLIQALNAWPELKDVQLEGPVTFDSMTRSHRADIVAILAKEYGEAE